MEKAQFNAHVVIRLPYEFTKIDISKNTQKEQWFLDSTSAPWLQR